MGAHDFETLRQHIGHWIVCVGYSKMNHKTGKRTGPIMNVAIECENCGDVLLDFDRIEEYNGDD
ncbi:MAG: hypothetical protein WC444_06055 [Candidatus Paceibacterota bacterium]